MTAVLCACLWTGGAWEPIPAGLCKGCLLDSACETRPGHPRRPVTAGSPA